MTIPRKPVTFSRALSRIAEVLGWDGCAEVVGKSESHLRKLGAPDTEREISLRDALRLDAAYRRDGGEGAPLLECYAIKLDMQAPVNASSSQAMLASAALVSKESGEAVAAAISLAGKAGDPAARLIAVREIEEAITELSRLLTGIAATTKEEGSA